MSRIDIDKLMWAHGWLSLWQDKNLRNKISVDRRLRQYKKSILAKEFDTLCIANVCLTAEGMELSGEFGVLWVECLYSEDVIPPYSFNSLYDMLAALEMAEDDLLMIGIPFCAKYQFHGKNAANKKRRNDALRRKYNCEEIERELKEQLSLKRKQDHERRKKAHENNAE